MLTSTALDNNAKSEERADGSNTFQLREKVRQAALKLYKEELTRPPTMDLGLHGVSRASLRVICRDAVLESSATMKKRYSYSAISSIVSVQDEKNAISALKKLQQERMIVSRLGFPEKAFEIDQQIEAMRVKAKVARDREDNEFLENRMKLLAVSHQRKRNRLEFMLAEEVNGMKQRFAEEEDKLLKHQEVEFLRVLEGATRRAVGKLKKCNCLKEYLCRHNKTASYNTRRPSRIVVQYRRNAKRLRQGGRPDEAQAWEEKAKEIDEVEQEKWRKRIADGIIASPWGANEAIVDQITEDHKKALSTLRTTHGVERKELMARHEMRRRNFMNTILAEVRKVKMQCRKQAMLRQRKNFQEEMKEKARQEALSGKSDGLKNVSKNLLGLEYDTEDKPIDWTPPTTFGVSNSVRLVDAVASNQERIYSLLHQQKDEKNIQDRVARAAAGGGDDDEYEDEEEEEEEEVDDFKYELGRTSGSKLLDKLRKKAESASPGQSPNPRSPNPNSSNLSLNGGVGLGDVGSSSFGSWGGGGIASAWPSPSSGFGTPAASPWPQQSVSAWPTPSFGESGLGLGVSGVNSNNSVVAPAAATMSISGTPDDRSALGEAATTTTSATAWPSSSLGGGFGGVSAPSAFGASAWPTPSLGIADTSSNTVNNANGHDNPTTTSAIAGVWGGAVAVASSWPTPTPSFGVATGGIGSTWPMASSLSSAPSAFSGTAVSGAPGLAVDQSNDDNNNNNNNNYTSGLSLPPVASASSASAPVLNPSSTTTTTARGGAMSGAISAPTLAGAAASTSFVPTSVVSSSAAKQQLEKLRSMVASKSSPSSINTNNNNSGSNNLSSESDQSGQALGQNIAAPPSTHPPSSQSFRAGRNVVVPTTASTLAPAPAISEQAPTSNHGSFPAESSGFSPGFGQASNSAFGQPSSSSFGQPSSSSFGQPSSSAFGQPSSSAFGQPSSSAFGQPSSSAFGQPSSSAFGQPSSSSFGQNLDSLSTSFGGMNLNNNNNNMSSLGAVGVPVSEPLSTSAAEPISPIIPPPPEADDDDGEGDGDY